MANTKACPSCNNDIPGDSRFCPRCGMPQAPSCAACGQSRLIEEFHNRLRAAPHTWVE
jgi:predicted amidophosphoribosyltransferase